MQHSKIDDSDLIMIEIKVTLGMGSLFLIYGIIYYFDELKYMLGVTAIINSVIVVIQCFLMYKFYIHSKQIAEDDQIKSE